MSRVLNTDQGQLLTGSVHAHAVETRDRLVIAGLVQTVTATKLDASGVRISLRNRLTLYARTNDLFDRVIGGVSRG